MRWKHMFRVLSQESEECEKDSRTMCGGSEILLSIRPSRYRYKAMGFGETRLDLLESSNPVDSKPYELSL